MWHFKLVLFYVYSVFLCILSPHWCISGLMQWIAWIQHVPTMASVWMGSATVSQAGEGCTVSCPGPSARTSAMATGPLYQTPGCAAVTPTGWDLTAPWVSSTAELEMEWMRISGCCNDTNRTGNFLFLSYAAAPEDTRLISLAFYVKLLWLWAVFGWN